MSPVTSRKTSRRTLAVGVAAGLVLGVPAAVAATRIAPPKPTEFVRVLPPGENPMIADGVALGKNVDTYKSSGLGPAGTNSSAPGGTQERYIDTSIFPGGSLPAGVSITEAQGLSVLKRIDANLAAVGLDVEDVTSMRVFLAAPDGSDIADFNGWNRAYRQYFANKKIPSGEVIPVPLGSAPPKAPMVANSARPSRFVVEVANLPVSGWLVEVEVDAVYPSGGSGKK